MNANRLISRHRKVKRQKVRECKSSMRKTDSQTGEFSYKLISAETLQAKGSESVERENSCNLGYSIQQDHSLELKER